MGLALVAYLWMAIAFGWAILWMNAAGAAMNQLGWWMIFFYLLSFFWTLQVINNIVHVIVSSVMGTWWYNPTDANSCWDDGLNAALCSALTYNFGSICFGSLLASIVQAMKWCLRLSKKTKYLSWVTWCLDCCLSCVQEVSFRPICFLQVRCSVTHSKIPWD